MTRTSRPTLPLILLTFLLTLPTFAQTTPEPLPSMDQLRQELKEGQNYPALLQKLARVLQLKGAAAAPYDHVELQIMRAETQLQLKQQAAAFQTLQTALKETQANDPKNPRDPQTNAAQQRQIRSLMMLLSKSQNLEYKPKTKPASADQPAGPFAILDPEQRKAAFKALFDESIADASLKAKNARQAKTLGPIVDDVKSLTDLRALEETVNGNTRQTDALLAEAAGQAADLLSAEVARVEKSNEAIDKAAHEKQVIPSTLSNSTATSYSPPKYRYRGLTSQDKQALKANMNSMAAVEGVADGFKDLSPAPEPVKAKGAAGGAAGAGGGGADFRKIIAEASSAADKAKQVLNANYDGAYSNPR